MVKRKVTLPHGFKAHAERTSLAFRHELNLEPYSALSGHQLAEHLSVVVLTPDVIFPPNTDLSNLIGVQDNSTGWSALTMKTQNGNRIIIHNNAHGEARQESNLMHELAHIICEHTIPLKYEELNLPHYMREFDRQQEDEANYLGSALQIPREGLLWAFKEGMDKDEICSHYNASKQMVNYRINSTGVLRQVKRWY